MGFMVRAAVFCVLLGFLVITCDAESSDEFAHAPWDEETTDPVDKKEDEKSKPSVIYSSLNAGSEAGGKDDAEEEEDEDEDEDEEEDEAESDNPDDNKPGPEVDPTDNKAFDIDPNSILGKMNLRDWAGIIKLAEEGENVNVGNKWKETPLHWSSMPEQPQPKAIKALLKAGADVNSLDEDGCTPLMWAAHNNHEENIKLLLEAGADPAIKDKAGRRAREHAVGDALKELFPKYGDEKGTNDVGIPELTLTTFAENVENNENDVVLLAYSPTCQHCRSFLPMYEDLARGLRGTSLQFKKVDVTRTDLPSPFEVEGLPTLFFSKKRKSKTDSTRPTPTPFQGERSMYNLMKWVQGSASNRIVVLQDGEESELQQDFSFDKVKDIYRKDAQGNIKRPPPLAGGDEISQDLPNGQQETQGSANEPSQVPDNQGWHNQDEL
jgi:thiol-disulfide isomerase/thioredoxin